MMLLIVISGIDLCTELKAAAIGLCQSVKDLEQSGLTRTVGADDGDFIASFYLKIGIGEKSEVSEGF